MRIGPLQITLRRAPETAQDEPALRQRVHRLEIALAELVDQVSTLQGQHLKLRKQFDGSKGGRPRSGSQNEVLSLDEIPHGDKAALRRALGVVPGQRYEHN